ncbi:lipopolysaccharide assembly protein LapB [Ruegeria sp. 6PALISEP08]|uniref:tetratricopeptide repeat protein n=1 Tax=Ruegeria sp. 6PALISEP08 TaxID=1225660 RepID=UPI000A40561F|nr:tetratricopeptide repeat protein [Ruegeria sp. 6PALISEP08]
MKTFRVTRALMVSACILVLTGTMTTHQAAADSAQTVSQTADQFEIEAVFLSGLADMQNSRPEAAIEKFSAILAANPNLTRVRLELARAYFMARQWNRARNEFFTVLSGDLPDSVRIRVLAFIREIDARRGFDWDLSLRFTTVSNPRKYETDQITLNFAGLNLPFTLNRDTSSEIGVRATGAANFRQPVNLGFSDLQTVAYASFNFDVTEARTSRYDDYIFVGRFGLRTLSENTTSSFGPAIGTRLIGGQTYENRISLEAAFERRNLLGGSIFGALTGSRLHSPRSSTLDGHSFEGEFGVRRSVGGRGLVGVSAFYQDKSVEDALENYTRKRLTVFGQFDARGGFTFQPSVYLENKSFKTPSPLLTGNPNETSWGSRLRIEKNDLFIGNGFSPFDLIEYIQTDSDIPAYNFTETNFELGLERRF